MSAPLSDAAEGRLKLAMDLGERTFSLLMFSYLVVNFLPVLKETPTYGLLLFSEGLVTAFMVFRRITLQVSTRPFDWLFALAGTAAPLFVRPAPGVHPLVAVNVIVFLFLFGNAVAIWGKLTLRRSFGLAAANRGVVEGGPYRFVRHPIYAGYIFFWAANLLNIPTLFNASLYAFTLTLVVIRVLAEERILKLDPVYTAFMDRVRFRLAPGLF